MRFWRREIRTRLVGLDLDPARENAIVEELAQDLEDSYQELLSRGATQAEARRLTFAELNQSEGLTRELQRSQRRATQEPYIIGTNRRRNMLADFWQDLRYGVRMMLKNPGFTLIAVLTLGLGMGANTAIFSVVNGVLLRPLAYQEPERIVTLLQGGRSPVSPANYLDLRANAKSFTQISAAEAWGGALSGGDRPEMISGLRMGQGMFELLGIPPMLGRTFQSDDYQSGKDHVLVLSHKLWRRVFNGDPQIVGRQLQLSGESYTVVGVMPPTFQFPPFWSTRAEMWGPLELSPRATNRRGSSLRIFGRLKPGVDRVAAQSEISALSKQLEQAYPDANTGMNLRVDPLNEKVVGDVRPALLMLSATVAFVLLIACANVACLLLARATARQKETAVRLALGANRGRILRQLLTESLLLSSFGAVLGFFLAVWGVSWITTSLAGDSSSFSARLPRLSEIGLDATALVFTFGVSLVTGILFGLAPALAASKTDLNQVLKESGRGLMGGRMRLRETLVVAELALALVCLIGAGLLIRSFWKLQSVDPGFNSRNLMAMNVSLAGASQYVGPAREAFYREAISQISALPGVESASAVNHLPLAGDRWSTPLVIEGRPLPPPGQDESTVFRVIRPGYFQTMGVPLRSGREFTDRDAPDSPGVIIVNETLAHRYWPGENPIGKRVTLDDPRVPVTPNTPGPQWATIVGVVKDLKQDSWMDAPSNEVFLPFQQSRSFYSSISGPFTSMTFVMRSSVEPQSLLSSAQAAIRGLDRSLPVSNITTMEQVVADALWQQRFNLQLLWMFSGLALTLAAVGLYGVMSFSIAHRTQEVGVRMALGARRRDVMALVLGQGMKLAVFGISIGLAGAAAITHLISQLLFGVGATDLTTFAVIPVLLAFVSLLACWVPAMRATRVDPVVALRSE
jgi:predicted permease